jgi:hypothetical protein
VKPADLAREIAYPWLSVTTVVPMIVSWLLFSIALFFGLFGLFMFMVTLIPFLGYLMRLLEARAHNKEAPAFDAELMSLIGNGWAIFPLVIAVLLFWLQFILAQKVSVNVANVFIVVAGLIFPAFLGVLSITRAPLQGLNPFAIAKFIKASGSDYALLVVTLAIVAVGLYLFGRSGLSPFLLKLALVYGAFLLYSLTGAVVGGHRFVDDVHIPDALPATADQTREELLRDRQGIIGHAYGFLSRGNRAGGLAHIQSHIDGEYDQDEAYKWFFNEMLKWENSDAALFFAQAYLHRLLLQQNEAAALKLLSQCLHANEQFRPASEDRDDMAEVVERHGRSDLQKLLQ